MQVEFSELRAHGVGPLNANRCENDLATFDLHVEILGRAEGLHDCLGQGELILGGYLG